MDAIDSLQPPTRDLSKPLRMPICDVIKLPSLGQVSACGKVEAGALRSGSKVHNCVVLEVFVDQLRDSIHYSPKYDIHSIELNC